MKTIIYIKKKFYICITGICIVYLALIMMPIGIYTNLSSSSWFNIFIGILIWTGVIIAVISFHLAHKQLKRIKKYRNVQLYLNNSKFGLLTFFNNKLATFCDVILILCLIAYLISYIFNIYFYVISITFALALCMHSMFNGKIYKITQYKQLRR